MKKNIAFGIDACGRLLRGVEIFAKTLAQTYGPCGGNVVISRMAGLISTKDGATVAREITLSDKFASMGARLVREASLEVEKNAGDGTTTVAILAAALYREAYKALVAGTDMNAFIGGIKDAAIAAEQLFYEISAPVANKDDLVAVARIASNYDEEIAVLLAEACMAAGRDGNISVEDGKGIRCELTFKEGMELATPISHPSFLEDGRERFIEQPLVAVFLEPLSTVEDIRSVLEEASQFQNEETKNSRHGHLLVFAPWVEGDALSTMVVNDRDKNIRCCSVRMHYLGYKQEDYLRDIAVISGANPVDPVKGMSRDNFQVEWFGSLMTAKMHREESILIAHDDVDTDEYIAYLKAQAESLESNANREEVRERIAKIDGGFCILEIGGYTEAEIKQKRGRVEDALCSVRSALKYGILPGGGMTYWTAADLLDAETLVGKSMDYQWGWRALGNALRVPFRILVSNSRADSSAISLQVERERLAADYNHWIGWDLVESKCRNLSDDPMVVDSAQVAVSVVEKAVSVTCALISVGAAVSNG